ncbi:hypothetical protein A2U01_0091542, partial [Trifolium medium]|nr:hypothetical protein [Trifolium medium]
RAFDAVRLHKERHDSGISLLLRWRHLIGWIPDL